MPHTNQSNLPFIYKAGYKIKIVKFIYNNIQLKHSKYIVIPAKSKYTSYAHGKSELQNFPNPSLSSSLYSQVRTKLINHVRLGM